MEITNTNDRHARFYYRGQLILATKRSFGSGTIEGPVQHLIRQQLKLTPSEFGDLIACPLTLDGYVEILKRKGWISGDVKFKVGDRVAVIRADGSTDPTTSGIVVKVESRQSSATYVVRREDGRTFSAVENSLKRLPT